MNGLFGGEPPARADIRLTGSYDEVVALQRPYPAELMTVREPRFPTRVAKPA